MCRIKICIIRIRPNFNVTWPCATWIATSAPQSSLSLSSFSSDCAYNRTAIRRGWRIKRIFIIRFWSGSIKSHRPCGPSRGTVSYGKMPRMAASSGKYASSSLARVSQKYMSALASLRMTTRAHTLKKCFISTKEPRIPPASKIMMYALWICKNEWIIICFY